jgi:hypothetical protein
METKMAIAGKKPTFGIACVKAPRFIPHPDGHTHVIYVDGRERQPWLTPADARREAARLRAERQADCERLWLAQCDPHAEGARLTFEDSKLGNAAVHVEGTCHAGRRVVVQVGWDTRGPYVWNGDRYRFVESHHRGALGGLVLDRRPL